MTGNSDDDWRPACGGCGGTSLRPRVATQAGAEPAVHYYECTACGRAWDGSEAPEPSSEDASRGEPLTELLLPRLYVGELNEAGPPRPLRNGRDE